MSLVIAFAIAGTRDTASDPWDPLSLLAPILGPSTRPNNPLYCRLPLARSIYTLQTPPGSPLCYLYLFETSTRRGILPETWLC